MGLLDRISTKKQRDTVALHRATLSTTTRTMDASRSPGSVDGHALLRRYGMWVHRCVSINAQAAAGVNYRLFTRKAGPETVSAGLGRWLDVKMKAHLAGRGPLLPSSSVKAATRGSMDDVVEVTSHPALELLQDVNDWTDGFGFRESIYADLQIFGRAFIMVVEDSRPRELWRMLPQKMKVIPSPRDFVERYEYGSGADMQAFDRDEVIWIRQYDPANPWGGVGPLEAWLQTVDAAFAIQAFQVDLMNRSGTPEVVIKTKAAMDRDKKRAFRADWRRMFGRMFRREESVAFLEGETEIERLTLTNRELEFNASEAAKRDQIANAFGVPKAIVDASEIRANSREAKSQHIEYTVWPMVQRWEDTINERLLSRFGPGLFIAHENPIPEDETIRIADRESRLRSGWSINEIRADEQAEALPDEGADVPLVGQGLRPLEQAINPPDPFGGMLPGRPPAREDEEDEPEEDDAEERAFARALQIVVGMLVRPEVKSNGKALPPAVESHKAAWLERQKPPEGEPMNEGKFDGYLNPAFQKDIVTLFRRQAGRVVARLESVPKQTAQDLVAFALPENEVPAWLEELEDVARRHIAATLTAAGTDALAAVGIEASFDLKNDRVRRYLQAVTRRFSLTATETFRAQIRDAILAGSDAGESAAQIARRIRGIAGADFTAWKAEQLARTETAFAASAATTEGWRQSGVVRGKQWLLAPNACPFCAELASRFNERTLRLEEAFFKQGDPPMEVEVVLQDGSTSIRQLKFNYTDISGPPLHPNCRCDLIPILIGEGDAV